MPATKLPYHVCSNTSEDSEHPAKELDVQGPHSRGWKSRQFCIYPQEIAFQLGTRTHVSRIQVLLHQLLIPERIDFLVGDVERGKDETYANARFAKLGYVSLAPADDATGGRAREFKSVAVDCEGRFIKLVIHRNHMTKVNKYNQVSVMGVNFLGEEKEANNNTVMSPPARSGSAPLTQDGVSNYDDLAFNMYTDHDTVKCMRKLETRKAVAARNERYDYAQNCKEAVELLQKAGLRLGKYEIEKRLAIEEENYDRAKQKKDHIDEYKPAVMEALKVEQLMEDDGTNSNNDILMHLELPPPPGKKPRQSSPPPPARPQSDPLPPIPRSPERPPTEPKKPLTPPPPLFPTPPSSTPPPSAPSYEPATAAPSPVPARRPMSPTGPGAAAWSPPPGPRRPKPLNKYELYEDRTLPAIRGKRLAANAGVEFAEKQTEKSSNLTDEDRKLASLPIEVFGEPLVGNFYAKSFAQKEEGLRALLAALKADNGNVKPDKVTRAATMLLQRALKDKVYTVCQLTTETLDYLTGPYANKHRTSRRELSTAMEAVLPELILKTGDNATRVQSLAVDSLLRLAEVAHARQIPAVGTALTAPLQGVIAARVAQARLEVVEQMVTKHGVSREQDSPMSMKSVSQFGLSAVDNPNEGVRAAGARLLILIYPEDRKLVRKLLPADNKKTRKSLTYRTLFTEFDKMDSKLERRRSVPTVLTLDSPAPLRGMSSGRDRRQSDGGSEREDWEDEGDEEEQQEPELSRSVRSKSLASVIADVDQPMEQDEDDRTCVFCGDINDKYVSDDGIEYHFWKHCPMLLRCKNCKQVVEIASYTEHLLRECKDHSKYRYCDTCHEAIPLRDYDEHVYANDCTPAKSGPAGNHCPLCHQNTAPYDSGWQVHLVTECTANPRNRNLSSALVRLHGPRRGSPAQRYQSPPQPQHERPPPTDSGRSRASGPAQSPPDRQQKQELAPPSDVPGRYSFASDAPAYLRQTSRSTSMADLRNMPQSVPPRRRNSAGDQSPQPPVLGRTLRDRQSPPEDRRSTSRGRRSPTRDRSPPRGRRSPARERRSPPRDRRSSPKERRTPPKNSSPNEARRRMPPPAREREGRSPSRNRRGPSRDRRDSSRNRRASSRNRRDSSRNERNSSRDRRDSSKNRRDLSRNRRDSSRDRPSQRDSQQKDTPGRRSGGGVGDRQAGPPRQQRGRQEQDRDRRDRDPRQNGDQKRRSGGTGRDDSSGKTGRDQDRRSGRREDGRDHDRTKPGRRDDRDNRNKNSERDRGARVKKDDSAGDSRSRLNDRGRDAPGAGRDRRSQSQKPSGRTQLRASKPDDSRRSRSVSRNPQPRRR